MVYPMWIRRAAALSSPSTALIFFSFIPVRSPRFVLLNGSGSPANPAIILNGGAAVLTLYTAN